MAILRKIAEIGEEVLVKKAKLVKNIKDDSIRELIDDMIATLKDSNGVGLAAPQVYESKRIIIVHSFPNPRYPYAPDFGPEVMINPEITKESTETEKDWEGCLSIPGMRALITRSKEITVEYLTREGIEKTKTFEGFVARIIQHEGDHLEGRLCIMDAVESTRDLASEKMFQKKIANRK